MTVSVFYPDPGTTVDGTVYRDISPGTEAFSTIRAGAGNGRDTSAGSAYVGLEASTTTDEFQELYRAYMLFDSSSIADTDVISAATLSLEAVSLTIGLGNVDIDIVASTPASDNTLANADYANIGSTPFSSVNSSTFSNGSYTAFAFDSGGLAAVSKAGVSKFGARTAWDTDNSFNGTWVSGQNTTHFFKSSDTAGTTSDPKLTVTHAAASTFTPRAVVIT